MSEAEEIQRLQARISELEAQLEDTMEKPPPSTTRTAQHSVWRSVLSGILIVVACLLAPLSVAAVWASTQISDTEQYVSTVAPLGSDPAVQNAIANAVSNAVIEAVDVPTLTSEALSALAGQDFVPPRVSGALPALAEPISNGIEGFIRSQVDNVVASRQFGTAWERVNRTAHGQIVALLEGRQGGIVSAQGDTVTLNLAPVVEEVKARLVQRGFTLAQNIPAVDRSFVLVQSHAVTRAQNAYRILNTLGPWLPVVALVLFGVGVYLARDRRAALLRGALGVTGMIILLGIGLALGRMFYLNSIPPSVLPQDAAGRVFDTLVRFLRTGLRATAVLGLVVALGAFLAGPSNVAVATRSAFQRGIGGLRGTAETAGWSSGRVGVWTYAHARALRFALVLLAGLVLMFWTRPTGWVVIGIAVVVLVGLAVIEFLGRPAGLAIRAAAPSPAGEGLGTSAEADGGMPADAAESGPPDTAPGASVASGRG
jgi:hypothetical protein